MFYSPNILTSNGRFALIWRFIFDRKLRSQPRSKEIQALSIKKACRDLAKFVPVGNYSQQELTEKMSLYLLGQLLYGIILVHRVQVNSFFEKIEAESKSLLRVEKKGAKRKREPAAAEDDETGQPPKKKMVATPKPKVPAVLDLKSLADNRPLVADRPPRRITDGPAVGNGEHDFAVKAPEEGGPQLLDWDPATLRTIKEAQLEDEKRLREQTAKAGRVSLAMLDIIGSPDIARRTRSAQAEPQFNVSGVHDPPEAAQPEIAQEKRQDSIWKDDYFLEPLPPGEAQALRKRQRRHVELQLDEQLALTHDQMQVLIGDDSALVRTQAKLIKELQKKQKVSVVNMVRPPPFLLKNLHKDVLPIFNIALKNVHERPVLFAEAVKQGLDDFELRKRRIAFDLISWNSDALMADAYDKIPGVTEIKVSGAHIMLTPQNSQQKTETESESESRTAQKIERNYGELLNEETFSTQPLQTLERNEQANQLLQEIQHSLTTTEKSVQVAKFSDVLKRSHDPQSKAVAARKFFSLLYLLRHKKVNVKQVVSYGEIRIKVRYPEDEAEAEVQMADD